MRSRASCGYPGVTSANIWTSLHAPAARLFRVSSALRHKAANAGEIANFIDWQQRVFGDRLAFFGRREKL